VDRLICAALDDRAALQEIGRTCAAVTIETENVPAEALEYLALHTRLAPGAPALRIAQDRGAEKAFLRSIGMPVAPHAIVDSADTSLPAGLLPGILKACRSGYDGKGQMAVTNPAELRFAFESLGGTPCVLEARLDLAAELSVILARDNHGQVAIFPVPMNTHKHGVLDLSVVPAPLPGKITSLARRLARHVATALDYHGVLCVEYFLLRDGRLMINEIAPRPHNSGHFTIEACASSQFEQQVRVLAGLPLGDTRLLHAAAMANLLGDLWQEEEPHWPVVLSHPDLRLHLYGKSQAKPGRKMGHMTALGRPAQRVGADLLHLRDALRRSSRATAPGGRDEDLALTTQ
jgi:5-(carboxyamino)imidazole ribonucleotide synthase